MRPLSDTRHLLGMVIGLTLVLIACTGGGDDKSANPARDAVVPELVVRSGGMTTVFDASARAFRATARNINHYERQIFADGKDLFDVQWVADPDQPFGGLGPDFDASSCATCHRDDGRAAGPAGDGDLPVGFVVMLSTDDAATIEQFGDQLTSRTHDGPGEGTLRVTYEEIPGTFADGATYSLRSPAYRAMVADGVLADDVVLRPRVAPHLSGLGLLELIPEADVVARADEADLDGDGISGRAGVASALLSDEPALGRFGWTASQPSVEQQTAVALFGDMGLTTRYFPSETCHDGGPCERSGLPVASYYEPAGNGSDVVGTDGYDFEGDVGDQDLYRITLYAQTLAVPAVRDVADLEVQRGWELFGSAGCSSCHVASHTTEQGRVQGLSFQEISPYTDLLLHDLGVGLSDQTVAGETVAVEWRTAPLWGVGLIETVNGHTNLLHDGRARGFSEAILWHGGEAQQSADAYRSMTATDRAALIRFLESL